MRSAPVRILTVLLLLASVPAVAFAQETEPGSPWLSVLYTWAPLLLIVGLWIFFMRKVGLARRGPNSYAGYMQTSQERMNQIEAHLASISKSLAEISDALRSRERFPDVREGMEP